MSELQDAINSKVEEAVAADADSLNLNGYKYYGQDAILPEELLDAADLRHLELEGLRIKNMEIILKLSQLQSLKISDVVGSMALIEDLGRLNGLINVDIEFDDDPESLPANWARLTKLKELRLESTEFKNFPEVIGELKTLESFAYTRGVYIEDDAIDTLVKLPHLKKCGFTNMHAPWEIIDENFDSYRYHLPPSIARLENIDDLDLSTNIELADLPDSIGDLKQLRSLNLYNDDYLTFDSRFTHIPDTVGYLENLEILDLYGLDRLSRLPATIQKLHKLNSIDIRGTLIQDLELSIEQFENLTMLGVVYPFDKFNYCASLKELRYTLGQGWVSLNRGYEATNTRGYLKIKFRNIIIQAN